MGPRSTSRSTEPADLLVVGIVRGAHGVRGEVKVDVMSDVPDRFRPGATFQCDGVGPLVIEAIRPGPKSLLVRFRGRSDRDAAQALVGRRLRVSRADSRRALAGAFLWADLIGLTALDESGATLGTVREVLRAGGADVLVIARDEGGELLLPTLESVVREIDLEGGRIVVRPQEEA